MRNMKRVFSLLAAFLAMVDAALPRTQGPEGNLWWLAAALTLIVRSGRIVNKLKAEDVATLLPI
jgi:hypothetical protein